MSKDNEFLEYILKVNKICDVKDAFEEFPPEDEWHKGKIENIQKVMEEPSEYNIYKVGDIVFVNKYKYSNGEEGKNHLFVIIEQNNLAVPMENFCLLISSQLEKIKYKSNILLNKDCKNNLNKDSIVKTDVIYRITNNQILYKVGIVDLDKVEKYKKLYKDLNNI